jgi:hypothetical protein
VPSATGASEVALRDAMNTQRDWIGSPDPLTPDTHWIDDETKERVALDGTRETLSEAEYALRVEAWKQLDKP